MAWWRSGKLTPHRGLLRNEANLLPEHALAAYTNYLAYFGTYTVDAKKHIVMIHVEGSLAPDYTDTDQPRPFKLEGIRLKITDGKTYRRVLERVR